MGLSTRQLHHLIRIFPPKDGIPKVVSSFLDIALPTFDVFGASRITELLDSSTVTAGATMTSTAPVVPLDVIRWIPYGHANHDDGAASHEIGIDIRRSASGLWIMARDRFSVAANIGRALERSIYLMPGGTIRAASNDNIPVGSNLSIEFVYVDLPLGEYVPIP